MKTHIKKSNSFSWRSFSLLFLLLTFYSLASFAQTAQVSGKLIDSKTNEPVSFAQVALFSSEEEATPEAYSDTDDRGEFIISAPSGEYLLKAFFIGYKDLVITVQVNGDVNLGELGFESDNKNLEEVVVETSKLPVRTTLEGLIITPENNLANAGGTLLDILRNTPSISVGDDGGVSLRGSSNTNILINGRNSSLTQNLDQLPASVVEEIKIINNPNARYDAEAEGGVIDIVLKKGIELGTHGGFEGTYGTRNRSNVGARVNHRNLKFNVYAAIIIEIGSQ